MVDKKISGLDDGGAIQDTDDIPIVRSGANYKVQAGSMAAEDAGDYFTSAQVQAAIEAYAQPITGERMFYGVVTGGDENDLVLDITIPEQFVLENGTMVVVFPSASNTGQVTLNVDGTGAKELRKINPFGYAATEQFDINENIPLMGLYNQSLDFYISLTHIYQGITFIQDGSDIDLIIQGNEFFSRYVFRDIANIYANAFPASILPSYYWFHYYATNGDVEFYPHASNSVNGGSAGSSFTIPDGSSGLITKDPTGNWWIGT